MNSHLTRREALERGAVAAALVAAFARSSRAQTPALASAESLRDDLHFLVSRCTSAVTDDELALAHSLGYAGYLEHQLAPQTIDDSALDAVLATLPSLSMTGAELAAAYLSNGMANVARDELRKACVLRLAFSKRQLFERMVEFWSDHFSVHYDGELQLLKTIEDRDVMRIHALGRFRDLLHADARSPAMLYYLDNRFSKKDAINENYARELMELHTLGADGPYTESDVVTVAECLTGWSYGAPGTPNYAQFQFTAAHHDQDAKVVFGTPLPANNGIADGNFVLDWLAAHTETASFVSRKLCVWMLGYQPPQAVLDEAAQVFAATHGDVRTLLRTILSQRNVAAAQRAGARKLKRPLQFVTGLVRQLGVQVSDAQGLVDELELLGHVPFNWPAPNGYPDSLHAWGNAVLPRWRFASRLCDDTVPGASLSSAAITSLFQGVPRNRVALRLSALLTSGTMSDADVALVQRFVDVAPAFNVTVLREATSLAASTPSCQFH